MRIIAKRPQYEWVKWWDVKDNLRLLLEVMDISEDGDGVIYDYYSMAHWVVTFIKENKNA
jgi:hypothetical protein